MATKIFRWIKSLVHRRYIDLEKVARLRKKGIGIYF